MTPKPPAAPWLKVLQVQRREAVNSSLTVITALLGNHHIIQMEATDPPPTFPSRCSEARGEGDLEEDL